MDDILLQEYVAPGIHMQSRHQRNVLVTDNELLDIPSNKRLGISYAWMEDVILPHLGRCKRCINPEPLTLEYVDIGPNSYPVLKCTNCNFRESDKRVKYGRYYAENLASVYK